MGFLSVCFYVMVVVNYHFEDQLYEPVVYLSIQWRSTGGSKFVRAEGVHSTFPLSPYSLLLRVRNSLETACNVEEEKTGQTPHPWEHCQKRGFCSVFPPHWIPCAMVHFAWGLLTLQQSIFRYTGYSGMNGKIHLCELGSSCLFSECPDGR